MAPTSLPRITLLFHLILLLIQATWRKGACITFLRSEILRGPGCSVFLKCILGSQETRNKTTSHHLPYLPFLSSLHLLRVSLQLDYISLTIALPFSLYKPTFKFWGVTKTWLCVAAAVHWQVSLDLDPILVGQASFTIAILATDSCQEASAAETESSSHICIRAGIHILGRNNTWMLTVNWGKPIYYCHMYLPEPEITHRLMSPLPTFTIAALKPWKNIKSKIDLSPTK